MLAKPHQVRIHRVNKVISPGTIDGGVWRFPLAEYHEKRRLQIGEDPAGPVGPPSVAQVTGTGVPAPASEALGDSGLASRKGEDPQASSARTVVEGDLGDEDVRGQAGVTPQGTVVRAHKGSKRPLDIDPYVWTVYSRKQRADEVARYERELEERRKKK